MQKIDYLIIFLISIFLIFGIYQFYFWCQRQRWVKVRRFNTRFDDLIPYYPIWSWVYTFFSYPIIIYLNLTVASPRHFIHIVMSFFILLGMQMIFFIFFPVELPPHWRKLNKNSNLSEKFLSVIQKVDAPTNCFPSMHISVATLTALHLVATIGSLVYLLPVIIAFSCVFTKQHYLADIPFGFILGFIAFKFFTVLY